jgi:hypothetical protein
MTDNDQWTKKDYKEFCAKNGIRYALDSCANPISPTKRRLYDDHLYWTGTDKIGVHIERPTKTRYNNMKKKLLDLGCDSTTRRRQRRKLFCRREQSQTCCGINWCQ